MIQIVMCGFMVVADHDVDDRGLGAAEPIASPDASVLLALPSIPRIHAHLLVAATGMKGGIGGERHTIEQRLIARIGLTQPHK